MTKKEIEGTAVSALAALKRGEPDEAQAILEEKFEGKPGHKFCLGGTLPLRVVVDDKREYTYAVMDARDLILRRFADKGCAVRWAKMMAGQ